MSSSAKCPGCGKTVYQQEKPVKACGGDWHSVCFKCTQCKIALNLKNFESYNNQPYCKVHLPKDRPTQVQDSIATKNAMGAPKPVTVIGVKKTEQAPIGKMTNSPVRSPQRQQVLPPRGPPPPGRGVPMGNSPTGNPPKKWTVGTENPPSMPAKKSSLPPNRMSNTPSRSNVPPPNRSNAPPPNRSNVPPPNRSNVNQMKSPPQQQNKKWELGSTNSVPFNNNTFTPTSDPSKAAPSHVSHKVTNAPVSQNSFRPQVQHKTDLKRISVVPKKEISTMEKQTNVGRQPVGIMYSSSDSDDEERTKLKDEFKMRNYHNNHGGGDQSTENAPENSSISYETRGYDQSTENTPSHSTISYETRGYDQSTESKPSKSNFTYDSYSNNNNDQSTGNDYSYSEQTDYNNNDNNYDNNYDNSYDNSGATEEYTETTQESYDNNYNDNTYENNDNNYDNNYDNNDQQYYDENGGYDQSYEGEQEYAYTEGNEGNEGW